MKQTIVRRRRQGYTIIELLVAMALIMTIMAILSEAFVAGLDTFSRLKAIGDLSEKMRMATSIMRRDLAADHFNGSIRLSDASFPTQPPSAGFFRIALNGQGSISEGSVDNITSYRANAHMLHMSVKLRGNRQEDFFAANLPSGSAILTQQTTFFNQPGDARYQGNSNLQGTLYTSQWGEVCYYLQPINGASAGGSQLYALYRTQRVVLADNTAANGANLTNPGYEQMSTQPGGGALKFNCPSDLTTPGNRGINLGALANDNNALLLGDVLSFDVRALPNPLPGKAPSMVQAFHDVDFDSGNAGAAQVDGAGASVTGIWAVQITIRVWDLKTRQTRQVTFTQDL